MSLLRPISHLSRRTLGSLSSGVVHPSSFPAKQLILPSFPHHGRFQRMYHSKRTKSSSTMARLRLKEIPKITSMVASGHRGVKVFFEDSKTAEYKYIWLRDNCKCPKCMDPVTRQKLVDTGGLELRVKPKSMTLTPEGQLEILWESNGSDTGHVSLYDPSWLYRYGQCFMHDTFDHHDLETIPHRPPFELWDRTRVWQSFPEVAYEEFQGTEAGLQRWLDLLYRFGIVVLRGVPTKQQEIRRVVERFAYIKETSYGQTFNVISEPKPDHLAFTGRYLEHHTDMNYREKSPGLQLLHCLKSNVRGSQTAEGAGGKSFFADGFAVARWLERHDPTAYHLLSTIPLRFQIYVGGQRYSHLWPVITLDQQGELQEIHYNNRTMGPLQAPGHVVTPYYHALSHFTEQLRNPAQELAFHLAPGDCVAFNNRRVLHGRTGFDATRVERHLVGCYVDIDEAFSKYDQLLQRNIQP